MSTRFPAAISPNYAEMWQPELLNIKTQELLTSPFLVSNVKWLSAKTFHFTHMSVSGFRNHLRTGGYGKGLWAQSDVPYTVAHSRDVEIFVDKADFDETNYTAGIKNIANTFQKTQSVPETDALFFSKVAHAAANGVYFGNSQKAEAIDGLVSNTKISAYTNTAVRKIKSYISKIKIWRSSLVAFVRTEVMDHLEMSSELTRKVDMVVIPDGGIGIETRYTSIDGVHIFEVIDDERFFEKFVFADRTDDWDGFKPVVNGYTKNTAAYSATATYYVIDAETEEYRKAETADFTVDGGVTSFTAGTNYYLLTTNAAKKINVLIASLETVITVPKIQSIYFFPPGSHTEGDGYLFQIREDWDTFIFPNGKNNKVDSIYVDYVKDESAA